MLIETFQMGKPVRQIDVEGNIDGRLSGRVVCC
jgi:hypothetical protein